MLKNQRKLKIGDTVFYKPKEWESEKGVLGFITGIGCVRGVRKYELYCPGNVAHGVYYWDRGRVWVKRGLGATWKKGAMFVEDGEIVPISDVEAWEIRRATEEEIALSLLALL